MQVRFITCYNVNYLIFLCTLLFLLGWLIVGLRDAGNGAGDTGHIKAQGALMCCWFANVLHAKSRSML